MSDKTRRLLFYVNIFFYVVAAGYIISGRGVPLDWLCLAANGFAILSYIHVNREDKS